MPEINYPIKEVVRYHTHYLCDNCDEEVIFNNTVLTIDPPLYVHSCPKCDAMYNLGYVYPCIKYYAS